MSPGGPPRPAWPTYTTNGSPWKTAMLLMSAPTFKKQKISSTVSGKREAKSWFTVRLGSPACPLSAWLTSLKTKQSHLKDTFDYIERRRSKVSPNFSFMGQLLQFEYKILSSTPTHHPPAKGRQPALHSSPIFWHWALTCRLSTARSLPWCWPQCPPTRRSQSSAGAPWPQLHPAKTRLGPPAQPQEQLWSCILTHGHFIPVQYGRPCPVLLSWWDSEGVTRFADKLQTDLRMEGRPSHYDSTVCADFCTSRPWDCPVFAPQNSPFHFKHKAINTCSMGECSC